MDLSEIGFYVTLYFLLAIIISVLCIFIFPENDYIFELENRDIGESSYSQYVFDKICHNFSKISQNIQQVGSNMHRQIVEMTYPNIAKNTIYR